MLISVIILAVSVATLFMLKDKFMGLTAPIRSAVIGGVSIVVAAVLTMEFFIYLHQRILAFKEAISGIPVIFVILLFAGLAYGAWFVLSLFMEFKLEDIIKIFKEAWDKVKEASKGGWFNFKTWWQERRERKKGERLTKEVSREKNTKPED